MKSMKVIAVIPAYDEEIAVGSVVLKTKSHVDEVFVVDDGSHDATAEIAEAAGATVVRHERNRGKGAALRTGISKVQELDFDAIVFLDADGQNNPDEIPKLVKTLLEEDADIVIGSRFIDGSTVDIPAYRRTGQKVLDKITNSFANTNLTDTQSGFRAFSKNAIEKLSFKQDSLDIESGMLMEATELGLRIKEIPISVRYDVGTPSQHPVVQGFTVVISLIRLIAERHALLSFGFIGIALLMFGLYEGITVVRIYNAKQALAIGTALISVLFTLIGTYIMFTGVILYVVNDLIERKLKHFR